MPKHEVRFVLRPFTFFDITKTNFPHETPRKDEILEWASRNGGFENIKAVVIDDDEDADTPGALFVQTSWSDGLEEDDKNKIINFFNKG